ncbi:hypothetical protein WG66_002244 [Moniliophthora roreri]|nr:hypothetical protein WG66_002244 [Moniliophthora roreri]
MAKKTPALPRTSSQVLEPVAASNDLPPQQMKICMGYCNGASTLGGKEKDHKLLRCINIET